MPTSRDNWLHKVLPDRVSGLIADGEDGGASRPRRAIDYLPTSQHYTDNVAEEVEEDDQERGPQRAIDQGVQTVRNGLPSTNGEQESGRRSNPILENAWTT